MTDAYRMTGMDKEIFNATRTLTSLLNDACNHWNYLCPYLEKLARVADDALRGYQKDYPEQVAELIDHRRKRELHGNAAAMYSALANLTRFTEVDIRGLENLAKYAIDHSMYGGGVLQAVAGAIREGKKAMSLPARNCDVYKTSWDVITHWDGGLDSAKTIVRMLDWLLAPAAQEGAEHGKA